MSGHRVLSNRLKLRAGFETLAEVLSRGGVETAGFVSTDAHFRPGNLDRGFAFFDEPELPRGGIYRPADRTIDAALRSTYRPATEDGQPASAWTVERLEFE